MKHKERFRPERFVLIVLAIVMLLIPSCKQHPPDDASSSPQETSFSQTSQTSADSSQDTSSNLTESKENSSVVTVSSERKPTSSASVSSKTTSIQPIQLPYTKKTSNIGFGFYGLTTDYLEFDTTAEEFMKTDYYNTIMVTGANTDEIIYGLKKAKQYKCKVWISIHESLFNSPTTLSSQWKKRFDDIDAAARNSGAYDALLGYYLDEPLLVGISHADLLEVTKYNSVNFKKRFFICFAVSGVAPEVWNSPQASPPLTPETGKYITDIAFDMYWDVKTSKPVYDQVIAGMKQRIGREDVKVWYIPCIMNSGGKISEQFSIDHLQAMYEYLKKEKNAGGLMCYTYKTSDGDGLGNVGLGEMGDKPWTNLMNECKRIGREIATGKMK